MSALPEVPLPYADLADESVLPVSIRSTYLGGVTPHELRNAELRETFRGYNREEVDALCERAAETIEHLERQRQDLEERLRRGLERQADTVAAGSRPKRTLRSSEGTAREIDVVHRTLLLAQTAADDTVAEAEGRALRLVDEAEVKASALVTEAETTARRIADRERGRLQAEVGSLGARRDALLADVDLLERFTGEYRAQVKRTIEAELERLVTSAVAVAELPPAPELSGADDASSHPS